VVADSARWDGFEFRDGDIVISTPPKCGTTWMQMMCALLIFGDPRLPGRLTELSPWIDVQTDAVESVFAALAAQQHRRFIKSHTPLDGLPFDERVTYICVGRDPRDVAVSWDNHFNNMNLEVVVGAIVATVGIESLAEMMPEGPPPRSDDPVERFWSWINDDALPSGELTGLRGMLHHLNSFWVERERNNVVLFHYADLQADLDAEMRRLAAALAIDVDNARWHALVQAASFEQMRDRADELAPEVKVAGFWNDTSRFFNQGTTGQWQAFMGVEDIPRYEARVHQLAPADLAHWVHTGWRAATTAR
jgi:hypothetical protein